MDDNRRRQALIEGFINMADANGEREGDSSRIFTQPPANNADVTANKDYNMAKDYVEMDGDEFGDVVSDKVIAGELRENTNIFKSAMHISKANIGSGMFMLPTFYPDSGYIFSPLFFFMMGCIIIDCTHMLLDAKLLINRRYVTTYAQVCRFVYGPILQWFLFVCLCLTQFGFCLMYTQLVSYTMTQLVSFHGSNYVWTSIIFLFCFPITCYSSNLSLLGFLSAVATATITYAFVCCVIQSFLTLHDNHGKIHPTCTWSGHNIPFGWVNNLANNLMVLEGIAIVLPVHAACKRKDLVPAMLNLVLIIIVIMYIIFGLAGYVAYGNTLTTSLVASMDFSPWGNSIRIMFMFSIASSYPVQFQSAIQLFDQVLRSKPRSPTGLITRLVTNLAIVGLAMVLGADTVNIVVSLVGALPSCVMAMVLPCLLAAHVHYAVEHPDEDRMSSSYWKKAITGMKSLTFLRIRIVLYIILSIVIMIVGTYTIISGIVKKK